MATTTYNIPEAIKAQDWYCKTKILPHFAPDNGICWSATRISIPRRDGHGTEKKHTGIPLKVQQDS